MNYLILAEGGFLDTIDILKQYGPFCGCLVLACVFFIWRDWKREEVKFLLAGLGIGLCLLLAVVVGAAARAVAPPAKDLPHWLD